MLSRNRLLIRPVAGRPALARPPWPAAEDGDWLLRFGVHQINPDKTNLSDVLGGDVVLDKDETFTINAEYMLTRHIGADLFVPTVHLARPAAQEHEPGQLREDRRDRPFAPDPRRRTGISTRWCDPSVHRRRGSLVGFLRRGDLWPGGARRTRGSKSTRRSGSPAGSASTSARSERWFLNLDVRYLDLSTDVETRVPSGSGLRDGAARRGRHRPVDVRHRNRLPLRPRQKPLPEPVAEEPPPPPPPPPPPEKCADGDNDGVCDADDKCPGTPAGTKVDQRRLPARRRRSRLLFDFDSAELRPESIERARAAGQVHERRAVRDRADRGSHGQRRAPMRTTSRCRTGVPSRCSTT